jgi:methylase of polypeptide subunit release factors
VTHRAALEIDLEAIGVIRGMLDEIGFDLAQQAIRPDYFGSPFADFDELSRLLPSLPTRLSVAFRVLSLGLPIPIGEAESTLGRRVVEALLVCGLLAFDDLTGSLTTNGFAITSRFGQYFVVSLNPYYPTAELATDDVYMGPDSISLASEVMRRAASLPAAGAALDLCTGSGIAALTAARLSPGLRWTGIDLSPNAVNVANFNAALNSLSSRYTAIEGDLFSPAGGRRFDLIVANPPFLPVPDGTDFPLYGSGGPDGLSVMRPLLEQIASHLTPTGRALIYAEGIGGDEELLVEPLLREISRQGFDVELSLIGKASIEQALYTLGVMLAKQRPSRLSEIVAWKELFRSLDCDHYAKFIIAISPGSGSQRKRELCADPRTLANLLGGNAQSEEST